jgi:hypothetical protein
MVCVCILTVLVLAGGQLSPIDLVVGKIHLCRTWRHGVHYAPATTPPFSLFNLPPRRPYFGRCQSDLDAA